MLVAITNSGYLVIVLLCVAWIVISSILVTAAAVRASQKNQGK